jgi:hypothetical protein
MRADFRSLAMTGTNATASFRGGHADRSGAELDHLQTGGQVRCKSLVNFP